MRVFTTHACQLVSNLLFILVKHYLGAPTRITRCPFSWCSPSQSAWTHNLNLLLPVFWGLVKIFSSLVCLFGATDNFCLIVSNYDETVSGIPYLFVRKVVFSSSPKTCSARWEHFVIFASLHLSKNDRIDACFFFFCVWMQSFPFKTIIPFLDLSVVL